jgi:retinol-binding protein 3
VERSINLTQTDWEGTGVEPDVKVPADRALERALELARAQVEAAKLEPAP